MARAMAQENPRIRADVIEVQEFPSLGRRYQVMSVPKTVVNDRVQFVGALPEELFLRHVLKALGQEAPQEGQGPGPS